MTIRINQIDVDFTLEKEKTFADLTSALRAWALGQNLAVLGILADGRALAPDDQTPLSSIGAIDVEAVPVGERDLARVAVLSRYFALLVQGLRSKDRSLIDELGQEYPGVREALFPLLEPLASALAGPLAVLDGPWNDRNLVAEAASTLAQLTEDRRRELQAPKEALEESVNRLEKALDGLSDLAQLFQKGDDRGGLGRILELFTVWSDLARRADLASRSAGLNLAEWAALQTEVHPFLGEAEGALASSDYILLTDLLEYEITPRLRGVRPLFLALTNLDPVPGVL